MLGTLIKYVGVGDDERYPNFIGHVGYVTSFTLAAKSSDGKNHVAVRWFQPLPVVRGGQTTTFSHFGLERFKILSEPENDA